MNILIPILFVLAIVTANAEVPNELLDCTERVWDFSELAYRTKTVMYYTEKELSETYCKCLALQKIGTVADPKYYTYGNMSKITRVLDKEYQTQVKECK